MTVCNLYPLFPQFKLESALAMSDLTREGNNSTCKKLYYGYDNIKIYVYTKNISFFKITPHNQFSSKLFIKVELHASYS